jgi:hypothetical protein
MRVVIVTGSRNWPSPELVWGALDIANPDLVVHGACPTGADAFAKAWARKRRVRQEPFYAHWREEGSSAGPRRNQRMLEAYPDALVLAFPHGGPGTADCMRRARKLGMHVEIFKPV